MTSTTERILHEIQVDLFWLVYRADPLEDAGELREALNEFVERQYTWVALLESHARTDKALSFTREVMGDIDSL